MLYKTKYDVDEITRIQKVLVEYPGISTKDLRVMLQYPNTRLRQLLGYKDQINGLGRNTYLLKD